MAISYPIAFPTVSGIMRITWRAIRADALTSSPFTFASQVIRHQGQRWEADIYMPPMDRASAEVMAAFLLQLDGRMGTFTLTPPEGASPQGVGGGTPVVNGASQTGAELVVDGLPISTTAWLKAGDYFSLGSGSTAHLHKVLADVDSDGSGNATLDIWPKLRASPANNATITITNPIGLFRMSTPNSSWDIDSAALYGFGFSVMEAL